jgi:peptide/nickel transport system permease protein
MLALFYAKLQWSAGPGRLDDVWQFTVEPRTGFALIDTWLSGDREAFETPSAIWCCRCCCWPILAGEHHPPDAFSLPERDEQRVHPARPPKVPGDDHSAASLPNIRSTLLTVIALAYTSMLEGAVLTETVFSWPGIGRYLTTALFAGDTTAVMGGTLLIGVCFVLINNLTDLLVRATDPRVR